MVLLFCNSPGSCVLVRNSTAIHNLFSPRLTPDLHRRPLNARSLHSWPCHRRVRYLRRSCDDGQHRIPTFRTSSSLEARLLDDYYSADDAGQIKEKQQQKTLFPGGFKRAELKVPTLVLRLSPSEVLNRDDTLRLLDFAISRSVGIVWLEDRANDGSAGGRLYEAACILKALIRDRAFLLVAERVDIAAAVGASGVILSDQGLPAIVARNMMMGSKSRSVVLPLVARTVDTPKSALSASSVEGADFLVFATDNEKDAEIMASSVCQNVKVPVFMDIKFLRGEALFTAASKVLQAGASGLVISSTDMKHFNDEAFIQLLSTVRLMRKENEDELQGSRKLLDVVEKGSKPSKPLDGFRKLDGREKQLIEAERPVLHEAISVVRKAAPLMEEVSLLLDAVARLDEPFLLVIVGEFNSGKSTFINALLGRKYLREGVVPTTNEITLLCYSASGSSGQQRDERHPDGQFIRYLPAPILKEMNVVDTPGTNVILQRQQRLTEEFVPRADMILFVISADRPLTESEVAFLRYIQQWKKKVVFILNKADIYESPQELEEAIMFIKANAQQLLNTEDVILYPVSARSALEAKLSASTDDGVLDQFVLSCDPRWRSSKFDELEKFLLSFLDGSSSTGLERIQLKLETPVEIASTLLAACEANVLEEQQRVNQDLSSAKELVGSVKNYALKMENESMSWKRQALSLVGSAKARVVEVIKSTLQLSNVDVITTYIFRGRGSGSLLAVSNVEKEIIGTALCDAKKLLEDYLTWLHSSNIRECMRCKETFEKKWPAFSSASPSESGKLISKGDEHSIEVATKFSASAASKLFEQEIREVVLGTVGGLGAASLSASLLTSVLPTAMEDLLALALCSAGGFLAISSFPAGRKEVINKVEKAANSLASEFEEAMEKDLAQSIENLELFVEYISRPYIDGLQRRNQYLSGIREEILEVGKKLKALQVEIQNLHLQ
ncbi:probable transmembrane GTPase FZO-like, chloroplastic [Nymphaea colorata]|nr:probable transmembrane GTPase FZO-like, chloroplastic [Nymphaea colorata]